MTRTKDQNRVGYILERCDGLAVKMCYPVRAGMWGGDRGGAVWERMMNWRMYDAWHGYNEAPNDVLAWHATYVLADEDAREDFIAEVCHLIAELDHDAPVTVTGDDPAAQRKQALLAYLKACSKPPCAGHKGL